MGVLQLQAMWRLSPSASRSRPSARRPRPGRRSWCRSGSRTRLRGRYTRGEQGRRARGQSIFGRSLCGIHRPPAMAMAPVTCRDGDLGLVELPVLQRRAVRRVELGRHGHLARSAIGQTIRGDSGHFVEGQSMFGAQSLGLHHLFGHRRERHIHEVRRVNWGHFH